MVDTRESWPDAAGVDLAFAFDALRRTVRNNKEHCESDARWCEKRHFARDEWAVAVTDTLEDMAELATRERKHIESLQNAVQWLWSGLLAVGIVAVFALAYAVGLLK